MESNEYFVPINEVAKRLDVPAHTLRYWEKQFATVIRPTTGANGRRYYRSETIEKIATIKNLLYVRGMTIAGVKKMIHNGDFGGAVETNENNAPVQSQITKHEMSVENRDNLEVAINLLKQAKLFLE